MTTGPVPSDQDYPADRNTRPPWVDQIPIPEPLDYSQEEPA